MFMWSQVLLPAYILFVINMHPKWMTAYGMVKPFIIEEFDPNVALSGLDGQFFIVTYFSTW